MNTTTLSGLECSACMQAHDPGELQGVCSACGMPLLARYDLERARRTLTRESLAQRPAGLWRYREVLPVAGEPVDLGEGGTPLVAAPRLATAVGVGAVHIKDESLNPTGSFKARGLAAAVSMARQGGARRLALPTAGNAGMALAAYAAAAGLPADIFCPEDTPRAFIAAQEQLGARVHLVPGLIHVCGARVREGTAQAGWFDLSTMREPYRVEGKKTMAYEIAEQMGWRLPDAIIYPTGGGTGLIGMWKAFAEMEQLGLLRLPRPRPRMIAVQAEGCAPVVRAFAAGSERAEPWENASTLASGLRVPTLLGDALVLQALRASGGTAVAVSDVEMLAGCREMGAQAGILAAPEGGATLAALRRLVRDGTLGSAHQVVLLNTGTALSYQDVLDPGRAAH